MILNNDDKMPLQQYIYILLQLVVGGYDLQGIHKARCKKSIRQPCN